jgi:hypothetical protein
MMKRGNRAAGEKFEDLLEKRAEVLEVADVGQTVGGGWGRRRQVLIGVEGK